jgi:hypothetical protein
MSINKWTKLNSDNFKYQLYYKDFETFSKTDKECNELVDLIGQYSTDGNLINKFRTISEAAEKTGFNSVNISMCVRGKYKTCNGFIWKKLENQVPISKTTEEIENELNKNIVNFYERNGEKYINLINNRNKRKLVLLHRFIYQIYNEGKISGCTECGKDPSLFCVFDTKHDIHHNDGCHSNNNPENLQRMCKSCHSKETHKQTKFTRKSSGFKKRRKVISYEDRNVYKSFDSLTECATYFGIAIKTIKKSFNDNKPKLSRKYGKKYVFKEAIDLIEGEIWKQIPNKISGDNICFASNKGRIKNGKGIITDGNLRNGYYKIKLNNINTGVHFIVAFVFKYDELVLKAQQSKDNFEECKDMSLEDIIFTHNKPYSVTVDHIISTQTTNNNVDNLRWSNKIEQATNRICVNLIEQWSLDCKKLVNTYESIENASKSLNINSSSISACCNKNQKSAGGFVFKFKKDETSIIPVLENEEKQYNNYILRKKEIIEFMNINSKLPSGYKKNKNLAEKSSANWLYCVNADYRNKCGIMKNKKIYDDWVSFIDDEKYKSYLLNNKLKKNKEQLEKKKIYNEANKEKILEYGKMYRKKNKKKLLEKKKEYYETNKEEILEKTKERHKKNKKEITEKRKEKVRCECGSILRKSDMSRHQKTKKHQEFKKEIN